VSFEVQAGALVGVVGRTGSGKSSCVLAVLRLVELAAGAIYVDGIDVRTVPLGLGHIVALHYHSSTLYIS
jgi:ABC-type multidrug transport system fused ATPase/permease subunit